MKENTNGIENSSASATDNVVATTITPTIRNNIDIETMRSIQHGLEQVEEQIRHRHPRNGVVLNEYTTDNSVRTEANHRGNLEESLNSHPSNQRGDSGGFGLLRGAGRSFRDSVQSALGSIRTQLESASRNTFGNICPAAFEAIIDEEVVMGHSDNNNPSSKFQNGDADACNDDDAQLREFSRRLEAAEMAHNNQIPLNRLQEEIDRRSRRNDTSYENESIQRLIDATDPSLAVSQVNDKNDDNSQNMLPQRRRPSLLLPSRRKAEEISEGKNEVDNHCIKTTGETKPFQTDSHSLLINKKIDEEKSGNPSTPILLTARSRNNLRSSSVSVLFPQDDIVNTECKIAMDDSDSGVAAEASSTLVYSWGVGLYSLHDVEADIVSSVDECSTDNSNELAKSSLVDQASRVGRSNIVGCTIGPNHVVCCTDAGQVFAKGRNVAGAINPHIPEVENDNLPGNFFRRPIVVEFLGPQTRIIQVACGVDHTVALRSNGTVLAWGSNEYGQLGHGSFKVTPTFVKPATMVLPGNRITAIAAGDGYTLVLTNRMTVLASGDELIAGYRKDTGGDASDLYRPLPIPALQDLPIVSIVGGRRHAAAITVHGSTFVWGENPQGCCAREYPRSLSSPVLVEIPFDVDSVSHDVPHTQLPKPLSNWIQIDNPCCNTYTTNASFVSIPDEVAIASAALGRNHTILVTKSGRIYGCGDNQFGQLGVESQPNSTDNNCYTLQAFDHPKRRNGIHFVQAQVTDDKSMLLDSVGDVWQLGGNVSSTGNNTYKNECRLILPGRRIQWIAAGGTDNVVAVALKVGRLLPVRESSIQQQDFQEESLEGCVEDLLYSLETTASSLGISNADQGQCTEYNENSKYLSVVKHISVQMQELLKTPAVLNGLFIDSTELDELYTKLLTVDQPGFRKEIIASIERGLWQGLQSVQADCARLIFPEQLRFLLLYLQFPLFIDYWKTYQNHSNNSTNLDKEDNEIIYFDRRGDIILAWCDVVLDLPYEGYRALMTWATSAYTNEQFNQSILRPLLSQLEKGLSISGGVGAESRAVPGIVAVLRWLYLAAERTGFEIAKPHDFYCDAISGMNPERLLHELVKYKKTKNETPSIHGFSLVRHPFLFSVDMKRLLLQMENEFNMLQTAATGLTYNPEAHQFEFNPFWVLDIDREHLLVQTLDKISRAKPNELRKKLRVVFKGEDGVDGKFVC
jgi:alpha-tubulin suppressor-like RCC1 family protein